MRFKSLVVLAVALALLGGCKNKKAKWAGAGSGDLKAFGTPGDLGTGEDTYENVAMDREGKYLLYSISRDPKEGWGFNHGIELYSYNLELKIKLPLGKIGRSDLFGFVFLGGKEMIAVAKTADTDDNGDIDERDGNALWVMAPDGLDDEVVSPVRKHVTGFWADPMGELVIFATADHWEGKLVPPPREGEKEKEPDWSGVAYTWNFETKETNELGRCLAFYGVSPDGKQFACLPPEGAGDEEIEVVLIPRDGLEKSKVKLPTGKDAEVVPLGGGRLAYTKIESSSTGDRRTLWIRGADGKDTRVTSMSVDTTVLQPLADGGLLFLSRAEYTVDDGTWLRALKGDGSRVMDLLRVKGAKPLEEPALSGDGKRFSYLEFPETSFEALPKGLIMMAVGEKKPEGKAATEVAEENIPGLGETIVEALRKALPDGSPVKEEAITVNVPMKRAVLPLAVKGEANDDTLMEAVGSVKEAVAGVLAKERYSAVFPLDGLADAVGVVRWHEEFQRHLSYLVAYNNWLPVRQEYDIVVEELEFHKTTGCADPRLVQLHCNGWIVAARKLKAEKLGLVCRATPLDPNMKVREGKEAVTGLTPGGEPLAFDVMADKVDPRRSHRSQYDLLIFAGEYRVPYYDAAWADATRAWIDAMRNIPGNVLPTTKLEPFAWGEENVLALAKWFPSTVVRQEKHLDVHLFIDEEGTPSIEDVPAWTELARTAMDSFTPFLVEHDPANLDKIRVSLYKGQLLMVEWWHKTDEELAIEGCDMGDGDACYRLGVIMLEKGQKMAAEYAFYDACDMGSQEACDHLSGAGAGTDTGGAAKPKTETPVEEPGLKKKSALPPEALKEPPRLPGLKKSEIQEAIRAHLPEVKYCFQKSPAESGQMAITVWMNVDIKGKVEGAGVKHSNVDKTVEECVLQAVRRITFPVPPDGQPMKLSYPFTFVP